MAADPEIGGQVADSSGVTEMLNPLREEYCCRHTLPKLTLGRKIIKINCLRAFSFCGVREISSVIVTSVCRSTRPKLVLGLSDLGVP